MSPTDERLLRSMIESVLDLDEPLAKVTVLNPEIPSHFPDNHGVVLDVSVRLATGEEVDLEMSTRGDADLPPRLLFYWARHFSSQLPRGAAYRELVPLRFIVWSVRPILPTAPIFHETFDVVGRRSRALFAPHLELHLLDLSRLPSADAAADARVLRWARFLALDDDEQASLLAQEDPIMSLAVNKLQDLSRDPDARRIADARERDLLAHGHVIASAVRRGRDEGFALGKEEGIALGKEEGIALGERRATLDAIIAIAEVVGVVLTDERRDGLQHASVDALRARLASLRATRSWE